MADYTAEAARLETAYWEAVGWALQYRVKVYEVTATGVHMKSLGDLQREIAEARGGPQLEIYLSTEKFMRAFADAQARWENG